MVQLVLEMGKKGKEGKAKKRKEKPEKERKEKKRKVKEHRKASSCQPGILTQALRAQNGNPALGRRRRER